MKSFEKIDIILKKSLSSDIMPNEELNQKIIRQLKEKDIMKPINKRRVRTFVIAAALTLAMTVTAFAALNLLSLKDVANHVGDTNLSKAFEDKDSITVNETVASGDYNFTFLGVVSGEKLSSFEQQAKDINSERTYAVLAIAKKDGSKMPSSDSSEYGQVPFFVSPLIKGLAPWQYNIASMNGGYSEFVDDGVMYRLIECDSIEMFANRGLYLAVSTTAFYDINAFNYDEVTGEITVNKNFDGANAIFNLPVDPSKANKAEAEEYIRKFNEPDTSNDEDETDGENVDLDKGLEGAEVIPESISIITFDSEGLGRYEFNGGLFVLDKNYLPKELSEDSWITMSVSENDTERTAVQISLGDDNTIIARTVTVNLKH